MTYLAVSPEGKTVIVSGAARGIGRGIAEAFATEGDELRTLPERPNFVYEKSVHVAH